MKKVEPRDNPCYCIRMHRASNALTKLYNKAFEDLNLTIGQFSLLNDINLLKSCNKSQLAQYAKLDRTTIIRNLQILFARGYITETPGSNKRNNLIQLTASGEAIITEGFTLWKEVQKKIKSTIGPDQLETFLNTLAAFETLS